MSIETQACFTCYICKEVKDREKFRASDLAWRTYRCRECDLKRKRPKAGGKARPTGLRYLKSATGQPAWTEAQDQELISLRETERLSFAKIGVRLNRSYGVVWERYVKLRQGGRITNRDARKQYLEKPVLKQRPCIGALCTEAGAVRKLSRPGQWLCDRCVVYTRGVHAGGV